MLVPAYRLLQPAHLHTPTLPAPCRVRECTLHPDAFATRRRRGRATARLYDKLRIVKPGEAENFFPRDMGFRYRRVQGSRKETTALRKLTLTEGMSFPWHTEMVDNNVTAILRSLKPGMFVRDGHFYFVHTTAAGYGGAICP